MTSKQKAEKAHDLLEKAIDALVELEGTVYPHGLPSEYSRALQQLRSDRRRYADALEEP